MRRLELVGKKFGRLTVLSFAGMRNGHSRWMCRCSCGERKNRDGTRLVSGELKSCGCLRAEQATKNPVRHGHRRHKGPRSLTYTSWQAMMARCYNPKCSSYPSYGGVGVKVFKRWWVFDKFLAANGERPSRQHSIDRYPNNRGDYKPGNVRWATALQQTQNRTLKASREMKGHA